MLPDENDRRPGGHQDGDQMHIGGGIGPIVSDRPVADLLALSAERDQWLQRLLDAERDAYTAGYHEGLKDGFESGAKLADDQWRRLYGGRDVPSADQLDQLRWGPGGRGHFGDPRPADHRGAA
jgi:hypothetical protein